jgi:hypothetical protein
MTAAREQCAMSFLFRLEDDGTCAFVHLTFALHPPETSPRATIPRLAAALEV